MANVTIGGMRNISVSALRSGEIALNVLKVSLNVPVFRARSISLLYLFTSLDAQTQAGHHRSLAIRPMGWSFQSMALIFAHFNCSDEHSGYPLRRREHAFSDDDEDDVSSQSGSDGEGALSSSSSSSDRSSHGDGGDSNSAATRLLRLGGGDARPSKIDNDVMFGSVQGSDARVPKPKRKRTSRRERISDANLASSRIAATDDCRRSISSHSSSTSSEADDAEMRSNHDDGSDSDGTQPEAYDYFSRQYRHATDSFDADCQRTRYRERRVLRWISKLVDKKDSVAGGRGHADAATVPTTAVDINPTLAANSSSRLTLMDFCFLAHLLSFLNPVDQHERFERVSAGLAFGMRILNHSALANDCHGSDPQSIISHVAVENASHDNDTGTM